MAQTNDTKHKRWVKVTHWVGTISFLLLAFSGFIILMCHPRLYWGDVGNDLTPALFELPVSRNYKHGGWDNSTAFFNQPGSPRSAARTYEIFNQNGWGRSLHFLSAWFLVGTGLAYLATAFAGGHMRRNLIPRSHELSKAAVWTDVINHLRFRIPPADPGPRYGLIQKSSYLLVVLVLAPLMVLSGLTMSPAVTAAYPFLLKMFFGAQSARTIHFFVSVLLVLFLLVHLIMIVKSGFKKHIRAMTIGK